MLETDRWRVTASPGTHSVPVVGLRVESVRTGGVVAYSCDTEPSDAIARLAQDAELLVHEANGALSGHSSIAHAAEIAARAQVGQLILVHLPPHPSDDELTAARKTFRHVHFGEDLDAYSF